jgi:succinyl-CoA:acetate CoA-transferase
VRRPSLIDKVCTAEQAAALIRAGMTIGMSGFTRAGEAKAVTLAMAERAAADPFQITLMTGASLGNDIDRRLTEAGVLARRLPFQVDPVLRGAINRDEVMFIDQHLSETVEMLRSRRATLMTGAPVRRHCQMLPAPSSLTAPIKARYSPMEFMPGAA